MKIVLNGEPTEVPEGTKVTYVTKLMGLDDGRGIAIAVDGEVLTRDDWDETSLTDGSRVEVLRAVQGG
jgi:sulfur carrier protein